METKNENLVLLQPSSAHVSVGYLALTLVTLALNTVIGVLVVLDAWSSPPDVVHLVGAICYIFIVTLGLVSQLSAPALHVAGFQQAFMAGLALMVTAAIVGDPDNHGGQYGPFDPAYLIFFTPLLLMAGSHPARQYLFKPGHLHPPLLFFAMVLAIPMFIYGVDQALIQRNSFPPGADPHHNSHWFIVAEVAFTIPLLTGLTGLRTRGWQVTSWSTPATLAALGTVSVMFPNSPSSFGSPYGALAIAVALSLLILRHYMTGYNLIHRVSCESRSILIKWKKS